MPGAEEKYFWKAFDTKMVIKNTKATVNQYSIHISQSYQIQNKTVAKLVFPTFS